MTQGQFDALVSLMFNIGAGAFQKSTLLRKLNAGDTLGASLEILRWDKANNKVMPGLTRRRAAEQSLYLS
jgi:lysozyme